MAERPSTVDQIYQDYSNRRLGLLTALTDHVEEFHRQCDPDRENLCLYGESDGSWAVDLPAEEVPPELPEPCLGINFARDGMQRRDWVALVAVHSDAWLLAVAFYYGARLDATSRAKLFRQINAMPTLYEVVTNRVRGSNKQKHPGQSMSAAGARSAEAQAAEARAADAPLPTGRLLEYEDIAPDLKGRQAELYWPDDRRWYQVEIHSVNPKSRNAKIQYTSGEFEDLDLNEIIREGHMSLID